MTKTAWFRASMFGLATLIGVTLGGELHAQNVPDPSDSTLPTFACTGDIYQVQSGQLRIFDPTTSTYTNIGSNQGSYNGAGYNVVDGYAYASQRNNIIRIGSDGETEIAYSVGFGTYSGDLDRSNNFYLRRNNNRYDRVDLATGTITRLNFVGVGGGPADVAFIPGGGDRLVGFSSGQMYSYNLTTLQKTRLNVSGGLPGGGYGATWTDLSGRLFTFNNNNGLLYEIFDYDTAAPRAVQVGVGDPSGNNDGFSCSQANFPNLSPLAQDDDFSTPVNVAITGDVTADNGNGVDNDPDGGALTVTGPDTGPSDGTLVLNPDGTFLYTPDTYFLGTDTFTYTVTDPAGLTATATVTIDVTGDIGFEVDKRRISGVAVATADGQIVNYLIEVENTGDIPLTGVNIVDTLPNGSTGTLIGPVEGGGTDGRDQLGRIDVGETWTYTISYTIEQGDIDSGAPVVNTVAVTTTETGTDVESDTASIPVDQDESYTFAKTTDVASFAAVNDPVIFTFTVENTGNVTMTDVTVTDAFFDPDYTCTIATLAPGISDNTTCTFTYNVTQADIDRGEIVNTATVAANGAGGAALPEQTSTATVTGPAETAAVRVVKADEAGDLAFGPEGDTETFTFEVFNDGNVTLSGLVLNDPDLGFSCALADLAPGTSTTICANGDPLSADLTITQALVDAATYTNTVTVTGSTAQGTAVSDDDTLVLTGPAQDVQLSVVKTVTGGNNYTAVGEEITYSYVVTNDGNITITSPITVADNRTSVSCPVLPAGGLGPTETITCTASYSVTQGDLDAGSVVNIASASVTQPLANGSSVTETSPTDTATANAAQSAEISIAKELTSITDEDGTAQTTLTYDEVDDVLNYTFTVTNDGNVTLNDQIVVTDTDIGATLNCGPAAPSLAPGDSVTCTASYVVTQPDLDNGSFVNTASAATTFNGASVDTATPASATANAQQNPALTLAKTEDLPTVLILTVGGTIDYTYVATNSGNVTLTDPITIDDDRFPSGGVVCPAFPAAGIAPGGTYTCNATYTITVNDVYIGTVLNNATATSGTTTSPPASVTVPTGAMPALDISKDIVSIADPLGGTPSGLQFNEVDDVLTFQFVIENTGTVAFVRPVTVTDPMLTPNPITCYTPTAGDPDFQPGETATCSGEYTVTQGDLDTAEVVNTAFASVEYNAPAQGPSIYNSPTASETVTAATDPELTVAKDVTTGPDPANADDVLTYTITATNSGNQTLSDVSLSDPLIPGLTCTVGGVAAPASVTLEPGDVLSCTGDYTVTQADVDAQTLSNTATASALSPDGSPVTETGTDTHPLVTPAPEMEIIKTLTDGTPTPAYNVEGDTVSFTVEVRNTGNVTLSSIYVTDTLVPGTCTVGPLAPGESDDSCRFVYTVAQGDVDAGQINNTASGVATPIASSGAAPITRTGNLITPGPTRTPGITMTKTADLASFNAALQTITYTFEIENSGNITLTGAPSINDPGATGVTCDPLPAGGLLPGGSVSCTGTYETEQGDVDAGQVVNTATASVPNPLDPGTPLTSTSSVTVPAEQTPSISLTKTADLTQFTGANQTITYTYVIQNTGNVTLTAAPSLSDDRIAAANLSCDPVPAGGLEPTQTLECTGTYETTQADVDAGGVTNVAAVQIDDPTNPGTPLTAGATETVPAARNAAIEVVKTPSTTSGAAEGDTITYSYVVTNRGNVTLTNIVLDDQHTSASGTAPLAISDGGVVLSLDPLESATLTATYEVTQADVDAGVALTNTVTANATAPTGVAAPNDTDAASVDVTPAVPELTVIKDVPNPPAALVAGADVTFRILVENTGNVTLDNVTLADTLGRLDGTVIGTPTPTGPAQDIGIIGDLDVGETWEYALTYTLTQADVDAGGISNSVLAGARDPSGTPVDDRSDGSSPSGDAPTLVQIPAAPGIEAIKTITTPATTVGAQVVFQIAVENTGNVTLTSVGIASDTLTRLDGSAVTGAISGPTFTSADGGSVSGTLIPGETAFYTLTYTLTQEDIDAGGIQNTATATGTPPSGPPVTDVSDNDGIGDDNPTVQEIAPLLSLTLDKQLASGGPTFDETTDVLTFEFIVTNTSNVTLTDPIVIDDPLITGAGGAVLCPTGPVPPNTPITCTGSYTVTQPDIDAGSVTNSATASSAFDGTPVVSPSDEVTVPASQNPALMLMKEADTLDPADFVVGAVVTYTYTATNTGNVTLLDPITITDDRIQPTDITCPAFPATGLAPTEPYVCTGTYTVTGDDVDVGSVVNNATATSGTTVSPPVSETTPTGAIPALDVEKSLALVTDAGGTPRPGGEFLAVGDILNYSFTVTNTGTRAFVGDIDVVDPLIPGGSVTCWTRIPGTDEDFRSGESATCTGSYTITQDDLDAGEVVNTAFASTSFGALPTVYNSPTDSVTSPGNADPEISFDKRVISPAITAVGQTITYEFEVQNTGNQTLTNITVTDPLLPGLSCSVATLDPGDNLICSEDYIVTQEDVDAGTVVNTATASGTTPAGGSVTETDGETTAMPAAAPAMTLAKSATPDPFGPLGSDVIYTFTVQNTGNVTLRGIIVTDPLDPTFTCAVPDLAPGDSNAGCTLAYTITQDDVDAAAITNTATVSATPDRGTIAPVSDTIITPGPTPVPALELTKTRSVDFLGDGGTVTYTFTVVNTGTVTLQAPSISDRMTLLDGNPGGTIGPLSAPVESGTANNLLDVGESWTYTATYSIVLADVNAGGFENTATATSSDLLGNPTSDVSDDGDDGDGNLVDDPTTVEITGAPSLEVEKVVTTPGLVATDEVVFTITARNTGNVTLTAPDIADTLTQIDGTPVGGTVGTPTLIAGNPAGIDPGEEWVWELRYVLTQDDVDAGGLSNTATVTGSPPSGPDVSDVSRDGDPSDGNVSDDPTQMAIQRIPAIDVIKQTISVGDTPGETVIFDIVVRNTGNVTLTGLALTTEDLTNFDGSALAPDSIVQTAGNTTGLLAVNASVTYRVTYTIQQGDINAGGVLNSATFQATSPTGAPVVDISDTGSGGGSTPTPAAINQIDEITVSKTAAVPIRINGTLTQVEFEIEIENTGNVTQTGIEVVDDLTGFVAPATLVGVDTPAVADLNGAAGNGAYDGQTNTLVLDGAVDLEPGQGGTITLTVRYDISGGNPASPNTVAVSSDRITVPVAATAMVAGITAEPDLFATKTASPQSAVIGDTITYTMTFENRLTTAEGALTLIDELPAGLEYTPGTATFNGATTPAPNVVGRQLQWPNVTIGAGETITIALQARILGGESGELTNRAFIRAADGSVVSNIASATVTRRAEVLFDCADIIGRVFDDRDFDGVFDEGTEEGLPRVRLVTVDGTLITTDEHGRFSVPCAALPRADIGSNFQLELDDRTLPTGFFITTENPRILRVTPGTMTVFNFGATFGQLIEIDLTAAAFQANGQPSDALLQGIDRLMQVLGERPSVLELDYYRGEESPEVARRNLQVLEDLIEQRWRLSADHELRIVTSIARIR